MIWWSADDILQDLQADSEIKLETLHGLSLQALLSSVNKGQCPQ